MTLKLDVSKAYDRVEWIFLHHVLLHMGLLDIIMLRISTVTYSFLMNGSQFCFLQPCRSLRQGDVLLAYRFICIVEVLTGLIHQAE